MRDCCTVGALGELIAMSGHKPCLLLDSHRPVPFSSAVTIFPRICHHGAFVLGLFGSILLACRSSGTFYPLCLFISPDALSSWSLKTGVIHDNGYLQTSVPHLAHACFLDKSFVREVDMVRDVVRGGGLVAALANVAVAANDQKEAERRIKHHFEYYMDYLWVAVIGSFLVWRIVHLSIRHIRTVACLNDGDQRYFARPNGIYSTFKYYLLDAPLFRKRCSRELRPFPNMNCGTLPTRFQTLFLVVYVGTNLVLLFARIDYRADYNIKTAVLLNRSGTLAVMNMLPLFLLAGRNNPLISLLKIPFDTYNLIHRWIGRVVIAEALMHTFCWTGSRAHTCKGFAGSCRVGIDV